MPHTSRSTLAVATSFAALATLAACTDAPQRVVAPPGTTALSASKGKSEEHKQQGKKKHSPPPVTSGSFTVMTYNLYWGTELDHVLGRVPSSSPAAGAAADYAMMQQTNFPARAAVIAAEIATAQPDLVGLQEVALWRIGPYGTAPVTTVDQNGDFVAVLLQALAANNLHYTAVSTINSFDVQVPAQLPSGLQDIRLTDRTVVLARQDPTAAGLQVSNPQAANFSPAHTGTVTTSFGNTVPVVEGWASVDVTTPGGQTFRFITSHLDFTQATIGQGQADELLAGPANTTLPVVWVGDLNTQPGSATYNDITGAGFEDVWAHLYPSDPGYTCCEVTPAINNPTPTLSRRIDYVLTRGSLLQPTSIQKLGNQASSRTTSGLWPSDHASLAATFTY